MSGIDLEIIGSNKPENTSSIENSLLPFACGVRRYVRTPLKGPAACRRPRPLVGGIGQQVPDGLGIGCDQALDGIRHRTSPFIGLARWRA